MTIQPTPREEFGKNPTLGTFLIDLRRIVGDATHFLLFRGHGAAYYLVED
jgi:hypothetical protein